MFAKTTTLSDFEKGLNKTLDKFIGISAVVSYSKAEAGMFSHENKNSSVLAFLPGNLFLNLVLMIVYNRIF